MTIAPPTNRMRWLFLGAVAIMFLHKVECWLTAEWLESPFFQSLIYSGYWDGVPSDAVLGEAIFLTFIFWLFCGLVMGFLMLRGGMWPTLALGVWGLTFILEWHHLVRTVSRGEYYTGLITAVAYLTFGFTLYLPELAHHFRAESLPSTDDG